MRSFETRKTDIYLSTRDYIFRYDPEWFRNIPGETLFRWYRKYAPRSMRNSGTFLPKERFDAIYNGAAYARLKAKYDPDLRACTLCAKANGIP